MCLYVCMCIVCHTSVYACALIKVQVPVANKGWNLDLMLMNTMSMVELMEDVASPSLFFSMDFKLGLDKHSSSGSIHVDGSMMGRGDRWLACQRVTQL